MERSTEWIGTGDSRKALARQDRPDIGDKDCIARLAAYEDAMPLERAQELSQAEKDGRLVVLPCKVGDVVFDIQDGTPYATRVLNFSYFGDHLACWTVSGYPDLEEFGKRIFLTREEAEAELKKREEADNEAD